MIVVDSSLLVNAFGGAGPLAASARAALFSEEPAAPFHVDIETLSAWRRQVRTGSIPLAWIEEARNDLRDAPILRIPHEPLLDRIWELRENVTPADGAYVAMAEELGVRLVTCDARLTRAPGTRCEFELIE